MLHVRNPQCMPFHHLFITCQVIIIFPTLHCRTVLWYLYNEYHWDSAQKRNYVNYVIEISASYLIKENMSTVTPCLVNKGFVLWKFITSQKWAIWSMKRNHICLSLVNIRCLLVFFVKTFTYLYTLAKTKSVSK